MVINRVVIYKADIQMKHPFRTALGVTDVSKNVFVRIDTDEGIYGLGEACPFLPVVGETQETSLTIAREIGRFLLGRDPLAVNDRVREIERTFPFNPTTRSAFDMALYDILGKVAELPVYALLGGQAREVFTDCTVGLDEPDEMAAQAVVLKQRGFPVIKVKLGTTLEEDWKRLEKVVRALGPNFPIRIDANQGWDQLEAMRILEKMVGLPVEFCEQPVPAWNLVALRAVRERSPVPIMADESLFNSRDAMRLLSERACDYFNIKLAKSGGLREAMQIALIAETAGIPCMVGCMTETRLGLTASAHLAMAFPIVRFLDLDGSDLHLVDPVIGGLEYGESGRILLPQKSGLGADLDQKFLARLEACELRR